MIGWLKPKTAHGEAEIQHGLKMLLCDGICSQIMGALTGGAFLVAFALLLGASNTVIGLLAAIGPLTQLLQIPAIFLIDRLQMRKLLVVVASIGSRVFWIGIALIPWVVPEGYRIPVFLGFLLCYYALGNVSGCSFNSWMRDFVPEHVMGAYFAKRMAVSTAIGAAISLAAGFAVDAFTKAPLSQNPVYSCLFVAGAVAGLLGVYYLSRIPEPKMAQPSSHGLLTVLLEPFRNKNFRALLVFLGLWNFAVNLAAPFFTVYMLKQLHLSMTWVLGLSVLSQVSNVLFLRLWGRLADRFSNKSILAVSGPLFMISILLWPFTTMPEVYALTLPLVIGIHILSGISTAGVTLCSGNIALKAAPKGAATAYLGVNALVSGLAATVAPIVAGFQADWFANKELSLDLRWMNLQNQAAGWGFSAFNLRGLDFLFMISFLVGLYALHRLLAVQEAGEVEEEVIVTEMYAEVRKMVRHVSNVAGLRQLTYFPYHRLKDAIPNRWWKQTVEPPERDLSEVSG